MLVKRVVIVGALTLAATAAPAFMGLGTLNSSSAVAQCRAYFGSRVDGICIDGPDQGTQVGTPSFDIGRTDEGGLGVSSTPLFPGQTINVPLAP